MTPPKDLSFQISTFAVVKVIVVVLLFVLLYLLRDIALIMLTAIVIASSVEPATKWFERKRIPRVLAVVFIYFSIILALAVLFYFILPIVLQETSGFLDNANSIDLSSQLKSHGLQSSPLLAQFSQYFSLKDIISSVQEVLASFSGGFLTTAGSLFGGVLSFILILVLSFYFAVQDDGVADFLEVITPTRHQRYIINLWKRSQRKIGLWMQGQLLLGVLVGVLDYLGLTILGVNHALVLAVLAGLFEIIPLFGPVLSAIPGIAVAFSTGGVTLGFLVAGLYLIVQQFENHLIYPLVVNKVVGVSPVIVIIALLAGAKLAGLLGILLSVPISAALMEYYTDIKKDKLEQKHSS